MLRLREREVEFRSVPDMAVGTVAADGTAGDVAAGLPLGGASGSMAAAGGADVCVKQGKGSGAMPRARRQSEG